MRPDSRRGDTEDTWGHWRFVLSTFTFILNQDMKLGFKSPFFVGVWAGCAAVLTLFINAFKLINGIWGLWRAYLGPKVVSRIQIRWIQSVKKKKIVSLPDVVLLCLCPQISSGCDGSCLTSPQLLIFLFPLVLQTLIKVRVCSSRRTNLLVRFHPSRQTDGSRRPLWVYFQ